MAKRATPTAERKKARFFPNAMKEIKREERWNQWIVALAGDWRDLNRFYERIRLLVPLVSETETFV